MPRKLFWGITVSVLALLCTVLAIAFMSAWRQKLAVQELKRFGISAMCEHEWPYSRKTLSPRTRMLVPLTRYVDARLILPVTVVRTKYLEEGSLKRGAKYVPASFLKTLSAFPQLESLTVTHSMVDNEDLVYLTEFRSLESLDLSMTRLHEGPLPGIEHLTLRWLMLNRTRVDDESLTSLKEMATLEHLDLTRTKVTDAGLKYLEKLPRLKRLVLCRTLVTESGYRTFAKAHSAIDVEWEPLKK